MLLIASAEKIVRPERATLVRAKVSPISTAWMGNAADRTTTCCVAASGALAATSQGNAAPERTFAELESAKVAIALSSFLLPQWPVETTAQRLLFHLQLPRPAVSALTGFAVAPTSTSVKVQHLATAVALRGSAVQLPLTALPGARLDLEPARLPMSHQTGLVEVQKVLSAKVQNLATAVAQLDSVARLLHIALLAARQRSVHAPLLTSHQMARVAALRNTSAKVPASVIVAVLLVSVERLQTTVARAVNLGLAHAPQ